MQVVGIALLLLSVGLIVAPVSAVVIIYRDNLTGLVVPPELQKVINGDTSFILNDEIRSVSGGEYDGDMNAVLNDFITPTFVDAHVDNAQRTFSLRVNATNPLNYDLTLNVLSVEIRSLEGQTLATANIVEPITMISGQSTIVQVVGAWTEAGDSFITQHWFDSSVTIQLANIVVDVNGIRVERSAPLTVSLPVTLSGVLVGQ